MDKFNPVYELRVEVERGTAAQKTLPFAERANEYVTITLPYSVEFDISRQNLASAQTGHFTIRGLGEADRNAIQKDAFNTTQLRALQFHAGYDSPGGTFMALCFNGTVLTAYSYRDGETWVTDIDAFDGGWSIANGNTVSITLGPGIASSSVLQQLCAQVPGLTGDPIIGNKFTTANKRGRVLFGNAWDLVRQESGGLAIIDNGQVKALDYNEVIEGRALPIISSATGLLGSPRRTASMLTFDMVFEPRLTIAQTVQLESTTNKQFNRDWKVIGIDHRGTISPSVGGTRITTVNLWYTTEALRLVQGAAA